MKMYELFLILCTDDCRTDSKHLTSIMMFIRFVFNSTLQNFPSSLPFLLSIKTGNGKK